MSALAGKKGTAYAQPKQGWAKPWVTPPKPSADLKIGKSMTVNRTPLSSGGIANKPLSGRPML
jgi:hypothetical protein